MATAKKTSTAKKASSAQITAKAQAAATATKAQAAVNKAKATAIQAQKPTTQQAVINTNTPKPTVSNPVINAGAAPIKTQNAVSQVQQDVQAQAAVNKAKAAAIQAQKPVTPTIQQQTQQQAQAVTTPTAEQLAQWAMQGGRTDLQKNSYWKDQPDDVKQKAWAIIQGQQQSTSTATPTETPTSTVDTSGTNNIFPSEQQNQVSEYKDLLNLGTDRWDTFLDSQISAFQKLQEDITNLMQTQVSNIAIDYKAMQDQMTKMQQSYEMERNASIARITSSNTELKNIAKQQEDNALKANELAAKEADSKYGLQIDMMRDNNSRYMGYLQGKFEAAGMLDSSAGLQLLGKYMTSADMNMAYVTQDRVNTQQEFLNTGREIMTNYFNEVYQAETTKNEQIAQVNSDMFDRIDKIQMDKLSSTAKKNELTLEAMKEGAAIQADIQSKISQEVQSITQAKQQEAESKFNVLQAIEGEQRYWAEFEEQQRQSGIAEQQWNTQYNLEYAKYQQDQIQMGNDAYLDYLKAVETIGNLPISDELKEQMLAAYDPSLIPSAYEYIDPNTGESTNLEQRILNTLDKISSGTAPEDLQKIFDASAPEGGKSVAQFVYEKLGANYQCVQFVRDIIPDMPTGLNTIQDKIDILVNSVNGIAKGSIPKVGDVMVLNWKMQGVADSQQPGHLALVSAIDLDNKRVEISQYNVPANKFSKQWIDIGDVDIEGYWRSPNLKKVSGNVFASTNNTLTPKQISDKESSWRSQLNTNQTVKQYKEVLPQLKGADVAYAEYLKDTSNVAAAEPIQVAFQKILQPDSTVMPGEFGRTAELQSLYDQAKGYWGRIGGNAGKLSEENVTALYNFISSFKSYYTDEVAEVLYPLYNDATRYGIDVNSVIGTEYQDLFNSIYSTSEVSPEDQELADLLNQEID